MLLGSGHASLRGQKELRITTCPAYTLHVYIGWSQKGKGNTQGGARITSSCIYNPLVVYIIFPKRIVHVCSKKKSIVSTTVFIIIKRLEI